MDKGTALSLSFLATHFMVERHREALLWSFLVARSDRDGSGTYSSLERRNLLEEIGADKESLALDIVTVMQPVRQLYEEAPDEIFLQAGLPAPIATRYNLDSQEAGYAYSELGTRKANIPDSFLHRSWLIEVYGKNHCQIDIVECFGPEFARGSFLIRGHSSVDQVFRRVSFEKPHCGDCLISSLLHSSGRSGFSAFLPDTADSFKSESSHVPLTMVKAWQSAHYETKGGRQRAISLIQRYSYAIGELELELEGRITN